MKHNKFNKIILAILVASGSSLATVSSNNALAQTVSPVTNINVVEDIQASGNNQGAAVSVKLKNAIDGVPNASILSNPNRLVLDLPNTINGKPNKKNYVYNHAIIKDASITTIDNRSRIVLNLNQSIKHSISVANNTISIKMDTINETQAQTQNVPASPFAGEFAKNNFMPNAGIKGIDFQRNSEGGGRVIINLQNRDAVVDVKQIGASLVADFLNTQAPASIKRNYDVNDFATPVKNMRLNNNGNGTRLTVEAKGAWRHTSYQADDKFIIEVIPIKQNIKSTDGNSNIKYKGKKLSLNFQDIDIRSLMQVFADFTNLNIVVNDNVQGNLTLRLKDVPWDQAFDIVLQTKNLGSKKNGNIIWVAPKEEMLAKEKQELESKSQIVDLEPVKTQTIQLNYHKAEEVAKSLLGQSDSGKSSAILSKRGSLVFDARTNQLFVSDTSAKLEEINQLIQKIDVPVRQVVIEARIVEANETFGRNLGAKLGFSDLNKGLLERDSDGRYRTNAGLALGRSNQVAITGNQDGALQTWQVLPGSNDSRYDVANTNFLSLPARGLNGFTPASLGVSLFSVGAQTLLNLELSALEADGKGKIVSSPRILTADKQKALIEQGTELPYQNSTSSGATSVEFKKANLKLEVTPQITPEGKVFLNVDINKDSPSSITNGSAGLAIDTKHVQTQVLVENGGTVMIGGIFEESERRNVTKVPFLGDIPVVGNLFKSVSKNKERNELLIFLTPRVIENTSTYKQ